MATAFVLSGGASLGALQVGMLRALFEQGIKPDALIGTSVGALNAAFIAGNPTGEGVDALEKVWLRIRREDIFPARPLRGFLGFIGHRNHLMPSDGVRKLITRNVRLSRLEEAPVRLSVVATEVTTGAEVVLSSGPVVDAVTASASIPGVFAPVPIDGRLLMDGGVANNAPLCHPVLEGFGRVIVLACGAPCALARAPESALAMVLQALSVLVQQRLWRDAERYATACDLHVIPPLCPLSVPAIDFSHTRELIDRGYSTTKAWLSRGGGVQVPALVPHAH